MVKTSFTALIMLFAKIHYPQEIRIYEQSSAVVLISQTDGCQGGRGEKAVCEKIRLYVVPLLRLSISSQKGLLKRKKIGILEYSGHAVMCFRGK
jgi:precorrin-6x reductase